MPVRLVLFFALLATGTVSAFEGPKLTRDRAAAPCVRTWTDVTNAIARSVARTGEGYFAHSHAFNDIGPIDTSGTLTEEELRTQFAMACILASPITVNGAKVPQQLDRWLADKMLMNVNGDKVARQGHVVAEQDGALVILKYLWGMNDANGAVAFYNPTDAARRMAVTARELSLSGTVSWTDRFDATRKGTFVQELSFEVPAHGSRLVHVCGKPLMRSEYRGEDAFVSPGRRVWRDVFAPRCAEYLITVGAGDNRPYRVRVNGLDRGEYCGAVCLRVRLEAPENTVDVTGAGADAVKAVWIGRADSMLDAVTAAYRLARFGKDYEANVLYSGASELPVGEMEPSGPVEERALDWIHDVLWTWQFDWLHARCAEANGDKARAIHLIETGCFMFRDKYGIVPEDPAFWAHYRQLTGKDRGTDGKKSEPADPFDSGKGRKEKASSAVEWQNAHGAQLAAATCPAELDACAASAEAADRLLGNVKGAYETDPLVATKVAAVTARVMEPGQAAKRRIWADALLRAAKASPDASRRLVFLDQLRWCGFADQVSSVEGLGRESGQASVVSFSAMLARELKQEVISKPVVLVTHEHASNSTVRVSHAHYGCRRGNKSKENSK